MLKIRGVSIFHKKKIPLRIISSCCLTYIYDVALVHIDTTTSEKKDAGTYEFQNGESLINIERFNIFVSERYYSSMYMRTLLGTSS